MMGNLVLVERVLPYLGIVDRGDVVEGRDLEQEGSLRSRGGGQSLHRRWERNPGPRFFLDFSLN